MMLRQKMDSNAYSRMHDESCRRGRKESRELGMVLELLRKVKDRTNISGQLRVLL
jgi:hypothetical protein